MAAGRVVVVGSINTDHLLRVNELPPPGATVAALSSHTAAGGKGLNQAVAAARQGAVTVLIGAVGDDSAGSELLRIIEAEGIDRAGVVVLDGEATGLAIVTVAADGENVIVIAAGANGLLRPEHVAGFAWRPDDVVVCQLEIPVATVAATFSAARAAGSTTVLTPAPPSAGLSADLLALVDILIPNEGELAVLTGDAGSSDTSAPGARTAERARSIAVSSGATVVVTLGPRGSLAVRASGQEMEIAAYPVEVRDTTGAGDAFSGCLAAALAEGSSLDEALRRASAAGSLATTREGAVPSLPGAAEVDFLLGGPVGN